MALVQSRRTVDFIKQSFHFVHRLRQSLDVIPCQTQCGDFGELSDGRSFGIRHHFPQIVHGQIQIVHPLSLSAVDFGPYLRYFVGI
jgi:hypothetical protein